MQTSLRIPTYDELNIAFDNAGLATGASEAHGVICGVLSAATEDKQATSWVPVLLADRDKTREKEAQILSEMLVSLHEQSQGWLQNPNFEFQVLMSPDDCGLAQRVMDLAQWCSGYLLGLVAGGAGDITQLPGTAPEIVKDIMRISEVVIGDGKSEQQEKDLTELVEYVRLGAHAVYDEIHQSYEKQKSS